MVVKNSKKTECDHCKKEYPLYVLADSLETEVVPELVCEKCYKDIMELKRFINLDTE